MTLSALGIFSAAGAGGVAATYELISTQILGTNTNTISFNVSSLGSTYRHLQIRYTARSTTTSGTIFATFNGVTGTSYSSHRLYGDGSAVYSDAFTSSANLFLSANGANTSPTNAFAAGVVDILDFASTTKNTTTRSFSGLVGGSGQYVPLISGLFNNTAAITGINLFGNTGDFITGSRFSIYGIRG